MTTGGPRTLVMLDHWPGPGLGGAEAQVLRLARAASEGGWRVLVASVPGSPLLPAAEAAGAEPVAVEVSARHALRSSRRIAALLRERRASVLHTHGFLSSVIGRHAGHVAGVPVVSTAHCEPRSTLTFDRSPKARAVQVVRDLLESYTSRWAAAMVAVAPVVAEGLREVGVPGDKVRLIPNGIDLRDLPPESGGPARGVALVGSVGRIEAVKGYGHLLQAAAMLREHRGDVRFVVFGDGSEASALRRRAVEMRLDNVFAVPGCTEDPAASTSKLDIFVAPSLSDTTNLALVEAMAMGKPVVATTAGGLPDVVGDAGLLVPPGDPAALAHAIERLVDDPELARRLGLMAAERAALLFDARRMVESYLLLYEEVAK